MNKSELIVLKKGEYLRLMQARHSMRVNYWSTKKRWHSNFSWFRSVKERAARTGRNPKTGEELKQQKYLALKLVKVLKILIF